MAILKQTARKMTGGYDPRMSFGGLRPPPPEPKLQPGPKSLLNTIRVNPRTADIENANSTNSPLLRLPSEIRNRIYEHVLGVGILHVGSTWLDRTREARRILPKTICRAKGHEHDATKAIRDAEEVDELTDLFTIRHADCLLSKNFASFHKLLNLLMVSRQIHREAALLPYQLNTFYFNSCKSLTILKDALVPDQLRAIQSIGFMLNKRGDEDTSKMLNDMRGIRDLSVFVQLSFVGSFGFEPWRAQNNLGLPLFNDISKAKLALHTASVTVVPSNVEYFDTVTIAELKQWSIRVENKLLEVEKGKGKGADPKARPRKKRKIDWVGSMSKRSL